jgi:hypothetical protein
MPTSTRPRLERMVLYIDREPAPPGTPIKVEPQDEAPILDSSYETSTCPTSQTEELIMVAQTFPPVTTEPEMSPAEAIPAELRSSSWQPQRKRKRDVDTVNGKDTGEKKPRERKRPKRTQCEAQREPEEQRRDAEDGRQNDEHEQPLAPPPRRSTRIRVLKERKDGGPSKVEIPSKLTSRKRAVRK